MLKKQLYLVYMFALFLPILAIGSFLLYNNYAMLYEHHEEMLVSDNLRVRSIVFEVTTSVTNICDTISEDETLLSYLRAEDMTTEEVQAIGQSFTLLKDLYSRQTDIASIQLYVDQPTLQTIEHIEAVDDSNREWFYNQLEQTGYDWSTLSAVNSVGVAYRELQLTHKINVTGSENDAVLVITVSNNYLKNRIDNNGMDVDLTVNNNPVFFSTWGNSGKVIEFNRYDEDPFFNFSGKGNYIGEEALLEVSAIKPYKSESSIYVFSKNPLALSEARRIVFINMLIVAMSIFIPMLIIFKFTGQLTRRVDTLRSEMHRVTGGDYNIIENFRGNDELVDLFHDLQTMIHSIKERDQTIFDSKMKEQQLINHQQKMAMELLSSKINPHFLYNTLETIRMKAFSIDDIEVARAVKLLGRYMRYNLESTGEKTTLQSELEYIRIYLDIQGLRFSHRIHSEVVVNEGVQLEDTMLLPLLIQPIVENAFVHAHEETLEEGIICIEVSQSESAVQIRVIDNGCGFKKEQLEALKIGINESHDYDRSHIGLYNIHQRLQLYYGKDHGLFIESEYGHGAVIGFDIPTQEERVDYA